MNWESFIKTERLEIQSKYESEIRFGSAYFKLKSIPEIKLLEFDIYGDWFYRHNSFLFLQQWNSTKTPNTNLVCINLNTFEYKIVLNRIQSVFWLMEFRNDKLYFIDDYNKKEYLINLSKL